MPSLNVGSHPRTNAAWCQVQCSELDNFLIAVRYYVPVAYPCFPPRPRLWLALPSLGKSMNTTGTDNSDQNVNFALIYLLFATLFLTFQIQRNYTGKARGRNFGSGVEIRHKIYGERKQVNRHPKYIKGSLGYVQNP